MLISRYILNPVMKTKLEASPQPVESLKGARLECWNAGILGQGKIHLDAKV
jgi:hypothetical protein